MRFGLDVPHGMGNRQRGVFDSGAVGSGFRETDKGEGMVKRLRKDLTLLGHKVVVSSGLLGGRWRLHAANKCVLVVSPHLNAGGGRGVECWIHPLAPGVTAKAAGRICSNISAATGLRNRGVKRTIFALFRYRRTVIVEWGFIDSRADMKLVAKDDYRAVELAILNGMLTGSNLPAVDKLPRL